MVNLVMSEILSARTSVYISLIVKQLYDRIAFHCACDVGEVYESLKNGNW